MALFSSVADILDVPILTTKDVEKLELESKFRLQQILEKFKAEKDVKYHDESVDWLEGHRRELVDSEKHGRVTSHTGSMEIIIDPAKPRELATVESSELPHSYKKVRNSLWIEKQPVYKAALLEWQHTLDFNSLKVEQKSLRVQSLKNEIYNLIGFYSVFQGVLVTASSQSSVLRCRNVGLPIALSICASIVTLFGIREMFGKIHKLNFSIRINRIEYKKAYQKICRLKEEGETFRFNDFPDRRVCKKAHKFTVGPGCFIVTVAVSLFSIVFILSHPLILCRQ